MPKLSVTKLTHACVRIQHPGGTLVVDPGVWSEPDELDGADAVLITHEHADHIDPTRLAARRVPVFAPAGADIEGVAFTPVAPGATFGAAGLSIRAIGERHAEIVDGRPACANFGYLVDERLYHPGDALARPGVAVETLLLPMSGPWLKLAEAVEFCRAVQPGRAIGIHDAHLTERGVRSVSHWLANHGGTDFRYLRSEETA